jgi:hypothetical protein
MLSTTKAKKKASVAITSVRLSWRDVGGCFGGMCKLPPLTNYLFDEMFRLDELRSGAADQSEPVCSPVAFVKQENSGETK